MILTLRTDRPESEIGLFDGDKRVAYKTWQAHRQLAETIHAKLQDLLASQQKSFRDLSGIIVYQGPGSFTGLRIGTSVANALAYSLDIPVVAAAGKDWITQSVGQLSHAKPGNWVTPEYGVAPHITQPRK